MRLYNARDNDLATSNVWYYLLLYACDFEIYVSIVVTMLVCLAFIAYWLFILLTDCQLTSD